MLWVMTLLAERQWCVTVWGMVSTSYYLQPMAAFVNVKPHPSFVIHSYLAGDWLWEATSAGSGL